MPSQPAPATRGPPAVAPLTSSQLDALVAPIALYPDALVAQVLAAASYADEVAFADLWLGQNQNLQGTALTQAVDQQSWDPSVKALTQFPSVLHNLAKNLSWTSNLGQAFENQQSDVMAAVQYMRAQAQAAGTLQSSAQIKVVQQSAANHRHRACHQQCGLCSAIQSGSRVWHALSGTGVYASCRRCSRRFFRSRSSDWGSLWRGRRVRCRRFRRGLGLRSMGNELGWWRWWRKH